MLGEDPPRHELELHQVGVTADHRQLPSCPGGVTDERTRRDRLGLALCLEAGGRPVDEAIRGLAASFGDQDSPRLGLLLEAGRGVDRVARDQEVLAGRGVPAGDDLAARDTQPDRQAFRQAWVSADLVAQVERRADRPLGVVAVGDGQAEDRHHRIADELLDGAAVVGDHLAGDRVVAGEQRAQVFGIELLTERGRAGNIGEQDRDEPSLLGHSITTS